MTLDTLIQYLKDKTVSSRILLISQGQMARLIQIPCKRIWKVLKKKQGKKMTLDPIIQR